MIRVSKVNIDQYSPYHLHRDQLPSEGEAPQYPIAVSDMPNREHLDHPMMNESNCEYNMSQEHVQQIYMMIIINKSMVIIITMMILSYLHYPSHHQ